MGGGADWRFWPDWWEVDAGVEDAEILKVADRAEVPEYWDGLVLVVNDHGNATLYDERRRRAVGGGLMSRFLAREPFRFSNGAIGWRPGGPMDCVRPFAKVQHCPTEGTDLKRTCYATGYADTAFSIPACTRVAIGKPLDTSRLQQAAPLGELACIAL